MRLPNFLKGKTSYMEHSVPKEIAESSDVFSVAELIRASLGWQCLVASSVNLEVFDLESFWMVGGA